MYLDENTQIYIRNTNPIQIELVSNNQITFKILKLYNLEINKIQENKINEKFISIWSSIRQKPIKHKNIDLLDLKNRNKTPPEKIFFFEKMIGKKYLDSLLDKYDHISLLSICILSKYSKILFPMLLKNNSPEAFGELCIGIKTEEEVIKYYKNFCNTTSIKTLLNFNILVGDLYENNKITKVQHDLNGFTTLFQFSANNDKNYKIVFNGEFNMDEDMNTISCKLKNNI